MSMKKTLVAAAILAVSGSAVAATGDWARVDNLQWTGTLTPQTNLGNVVITDRYDRKILSGKTFPIGFVNDTDLSFSFNYGDPAYLKFQAFTDDGISTGGTANVYDEGVDSVAVITNSSWEVNNFAYKSRSGSLELTHGGDFVVQIEGQGAGAGNVQKFDIANTTITPDAANSDAGGDVKVFISGANITNADGTALSIDPTKPVGSVVAYVSLTATEL